MRTSPRACPGGREVYVENAVQSAASSVARMMRRVERTRQTGIDRFRCSWGRGPHGPRPHERTSTSVESVHADGARGVDSTLPVDRVGAGLAEVIRRLL